MTTVIEIGHIIARIEHEMHCDSVTMMQGPCDCNRREMEKLVRKWFRAWKKSQQAAPMTIPFDVQIK